MNLVKVSFPTVSYKILQEYFKILLDFDKWPTRCNVRILYF